jgi:mono/diheme cytochrome c family protein
MKRAATYSICLRLLALLLVLPPMCACRQKMASQPSYGPLQASADSDERWEARNSVEGTIARGHLQIDRHRFTGYAAEPTQTTDPPTEPQYVETFPVPVTRSMLQHGYERFMIYCVHCHDPLGSGHGRVVESGYSKPPSYHSDRMRQAPVGRLFAVISEGFGSMPSHAEQIPVEDRWAIVAYLRALQMSQHFPETDLTAEMQARLTTAGGK